MMNLSPYQSPIVPYEYPDPPTWPSECQDAVTGRPEYRTDSINPIRRVRFSSAMHRYAHPHSSRSLQSSALSYFLETSLSPNQHAMPNASPFSLFEDGTSHRPLSPSEWPWLALQTQVSRCSGFRSADSTRSTLQWLLDPNRNILQVD